MQQHLQASIRQASGNEAVAPCQLHHSCCQAVVPEAAAAARGCQFRGRPLHAGCEIIRCRNNDIACTQWHKADIAACSSSTKAPLYSRLPGKQSSLLVVSLQKGTMSHLRRALLLLRLQAAPWKEMGAAPAGRVAAPRGLRRA